MKIPFFSNRAERAPVEKRNAPYTDAIVAQIIAMTQGANGEPSPQASAALEIAAGAIARAFESATVTGATVPPGQLGSLARAVVTHGEACAWYDGMDLIEVVNYDVRGRASRSTWRYVINVDSPGGHLIDTTVMRSRMVHWQYSYDLNRPWIGVGPLQRAILSGQLIANIENSMKQEAGGAVGYLLPIPTDSDDESVTELKADLKALNGRTTVVETTASGWGEGRMSAPRQDFVPQRIGMNPPLSVPQVHFAIQNSVLACCGVPIELVTTADGTGQREAWRRFLHGTVQPLAIVLQSELSRVYGRDVTIDFKRLFASDIAGKARAFQSMVNGNMEIQQAAALSGLLAEDG